MVFTANGKTLAWRRDDVDLYQFHVTIPDGVSTLHAHLDRIVTTNITQKMALFDWETLMLYPANTPVRDIPIQPSLIVPSGWRLGTALSPIGGSAYPLPSPGSTTHFRGHKCGAARGSADTRRPIFQEFAVAPEISPKHVVDVASDAPEDLKLSPTVLAGIANLVREADELVPFAPLPRLPFPYRAIGRRLAAT